MSAGSEFHSFGEETEERRNLFDRIVPSDIEGPGAEPGRLTECCALLECHSRSGELDQVLRCTASQAVARDGLMELSLY